MSECEGCNTAAGQDVCPTHGDPRLYPDGNVPGPDFVKENEELRKKIAEVEKRELSAKKELGHALIRVAEVEKREQELRDRLEAVQWVIGEEAITSHVAAYQAHIGNDESAKE